MVKSEGDGGDRKRTELKRERKLNHSESMIVDRITELEVKLSFHSSTIESLNSVITEQQKELTGLSLEVRKLRSEIQNLKDVSDIEGGDETPPHY